jgi:hypothetical protein
MPGEDSVYLSVQYRISYLVYWPAMKGAACGRREFLEFLASSPLLATQDLPSAAITSPKGALSVMEFEALAHKALPPAHWGYLTSGVDDDLTLRMNREAMGHFQLRARRLTGIVKADLSTEIFGTRWEMPVYLSALSGQKAYYPEGELATARAAKAQKTTQMLSSSTSTAVEDVSKALGDAPWYQLYTSRSHGKRPRN